jgi:serine/threonine protein kinase
MGRGSLFDLLHDEKFALGWDLRVSICRDVSSGMNFLHTTTPPVLHRDLKVCVVVFYCFQLLLFSCNVLFENLEFFTSHLCVCA